MTAASAETADSFEIYKFILSTTSSVAREEPHRDTPNRPPQVPEKQTHDTPASSIKSTDAQFADLHDRLVSMDHAINNLFRHLATHSGNSEERHKELTSKMTSAEHIRALDARLQAIEKTVQAIQHDVQGKDYHGQLANLHDSLRDTHNSLLENLPHTLHQGKNPVSTSSPQLAFLGLRS